MTNEALFDLFDREQRLEVVIPGARKEVLACIVRFVRPAPGMNMVLYSRMPPEEADEIITAQVAYFKPLGQPFEWVVYEHDQPADLLERLARFGFASGEPEPVLKLDLHALPPVLLAPPRADVRRITTREGLEDVIQVLEQVYGGSFDWVRARMGSHLEVSGYLSLYAAYVDGTPASVGWTYFAPGGSPPHFAGLWGGSTVEAFRGLGLYTALLAVRAQEALARGSDYLYVNASEMSEPILSKYGFDLLATMRSCVYQG